MSLTFIFGPSGAGKSYYLYNHIIEESIRHPKRNYIVLVPEQFTMQTQMDLVRLHPRKGILNIDVLSFGRLAYRVFEETGAGNLPVLDDEGKNLILRKIADDCEGKLTVLSGNMKKLGYISEVKSVISEFTQYDIGAEDIEKVMEVAGEDSRLSAKLKDILLLYQEFDQALNEKYMTKEELLDVLAGVVSQSEMLKNSTIVLDGFTGFTPVQNRLLRELMVYCRDVMVTVTMDPREDPYTYRHPYQLFALGKHMVTSLMKLAQETDVEINSPVQLEGNPPYRFRGHPELAFLERHLFRQEGEVYEEKPDDIRILAARSPYEEAVSVAESIRALVREEGMRYREIGVIVTDMDTYGDELTRAFALYDIPVFMDHKRSILLNSFVEYLRSLIDMAVQNFTTDSVFRFLRTGLSGFTREDTDRLENYCIALGIKGYKSWQQSFVKKPTDTSEEDLDQINHLRVMLVEKLDDLMFVLRQRTKTVRDITMALYTFIAKEGLQEKLKAQEDAFTSDGELALAKEYAQVYRIVIDLFDKFVDLLGDEPVSLAEYGELLDAGLLEAKVGVIPPSVDQVVAGDLKRSRLKDIKALFLVGASDERLPGDLLSGGLLTERDRQVFAREKLPLAANGKEKAYEQKFYLYMNLTKPSRKLMISYSKTRTDGKSARPSYLIREILRLFPKITVIEPEKQPLSMREMTPKQGITCLIGGLREGMDPFAKELYTWYKRHPDWQGKLNDILEAHFYRCPIKGLTPDTAKRLYGEAFQDSITRMEQYASCAFAHFLQYGLGLKEREEYTFEPVDMGNVCHRALERYSVILQERKLSWTDISSEKQQELIAECVEEAIADYDHSVLYSSARNEQMIERMKRLLNVSVWALTRQLKGGDFAPEAFEYRFDHGKIDRIDTWKAADSLYVKVIDYKTGAREFDPSSLYYGLSLQLMVYMDAAIRMEKEKAPGKMVLPAGVFYYRIWDPLVDKKEKSVEEAILKELRPDGVVSEKEDVLHHLDHQSEGDSLVIPVKYKKDGSPYKASRVVSEQAFEAMMHHAVRKVEEDHTGILSGDTRAMPYRMGQKTGCDYCPYRNICGFDHRLTGYQYREMEHMSREEAIKAMEEEDL